jgi:hypothetical protein
VGWRGRHYYLSGSDVGRKTFDDTETRILFLVVQQVLWGEELQSTRY